MALSPEDLERHARHILLKEIGGAGVARLKQASVSIVGAGALGGPCALFLAAAGVGRIEILDDDVVERSNLQRQVQFAEADLGAPKADALAARLREQNPVVKIISRRERFQPGAALSGAVLIDASDNFPTRYALNGLAVASDRPMVSGAAAGWRAQISVYGPALGPDAPCYRCVVAEPPPDADTCETIGVVGAVTGVAAARMALETLKVLLDLPETLAGRLWLFDGLSGESRVARTRRDPACPACGPALGA